MQLATKFINWMRKSTQNNHKPQHPMWMRIICLLLMFTFIPVFQFDAGAALATRYVWLISKPSMRVSYTNGGVFVLNTETNSGVKMTLQSDGYYVATGYIPVVTDYTNETIPEVQDWKGTPFRYTGRAKPYPGDGEVHLEDNVEYYAGNVAGGAKCKIATKRSELNKYSESGYGPDAVRAPSAFSSGRTTYYIKPRVHKNQIGPGDTRVMRFNVSVFQFKSTKPLPGLYDPPEPEVHAKLDISANDIRENYKEFDVRGKTSTEVVFDPSASTSKLGWKNYGMDGDSALSDWTLRDSWNGKPSRQRFTVPYTKKNIGFTGKPGTIRDTISGEVVVSDGTVSDRAKASAKVNLTFYNDEPNASIGSVKSQNLSQGGSGYDSTFYYTGVPIQITDASYDPEDRSYDEQTKEPVIQYAIQYQGQNILVTENFQTPNKIDDLFDSAAAKDGTLTVSLKNPGYYTIRAWVQDEIGATATQTKTIKVSGKPEPPTAVINGGNYTFVNYPLALSDASTDPNDDIVSWVWGDVTMEDETGAQVPAAGVTDALRDAAYQVGSTGKPADIGGTLTFSAPGIYKVGLTVTDATKLTDQTSKTIKVIRDIPVAEIEPGPEDPKNPSESDPHYGIDPEDGKEKIFVKQNRKVTLDASKSLDPPASKINWAATEWDYANTDAMPDYDMQSVKLDRSSTSKKQVLLAKNVGEFKVMLTLHNEYSDKLPETDPDLVARTKTVIVKVVPDEPPVSTIQVDNVNPNFHDNPTAVDVKVVATGKSLDNDFIDYYNWRLYRDNNDDGQYAESELLTKKDKTKTAEVSIPVRFETGNTSMFLGQVEAFERFGQETIQEFITGEDIRTSESEMEFEVNWRPCISYTMREFAYVDDTLTITPILKDENVETCSVEWVLKKKDAKGAYQAVEPTAFKPNVFADDPVWELGLHGGTVRITEDGFYRLDATITDAEGHSETFSSTEIRIYDVPRAVISDKPLYRWNNTAFQFKESRKFTLDGNASYVNDSTGEAKHQLNRSRDEWTITPLDGQSVEGIYVGKTAAGTERVASNSTTIFDMGANSFDEVLAILEPGRYRVDYRVTNTYGKKSPIKTEEIIIVEDTAPIITGAVQPSVDRGSADDGAKTVISIGDLEIRSDDMDIINENWTVELIYDKANDGFQNDAWTRVDNKFISIDRDTKQLVIANVAIPEGNLGKYQFRVYAKDIFGQETLPIVPESERKDATKIFETQVDNVKPNGTFTTKAESKADVVFAFGSRSESNQLTFGGGGNSLNAEFGEKTIVLPAGTYQLECWGASGGPSQAGNKGGAGAYATGQITLTKPSTVTVRVGEQGKKTFGDNGFQAYNGGGFVWFNSGGGGGKTDITIDGELVMVAAAGGGAGNRGGDGGYGGDTAFGGSATYPNGSECFNGANQKNSRVSYYSSYLNKNMDGSENPHGEDFGHGGPGGSGGAGYVPGRSGGAFGNTGGGGGTSFLNSKLKNATAIPGNMTFNSPDGRSELGHIGSGYAKITSLANTSQAIEEIKNAAKTFENRFGGEAGNDFDVTVEAVETTSSNVSSTDMDFDYIVSNWEKVGSDIWTAKNGVLSCSIPQTDWTGEYGGWRATAVLNDAAYNAADIELSFDVNAKAAALMEGPCWRVTKNSDGTYNGYFMNVSAHMGSLALMRFDHVSLDGNFQTGDLGGLVWCILESDSHGHGNKNPPSKGEVRVCSCNGHKATVTMLEVCPQSRYGQGNYIDGSVVVSMKGNHIVVTVNGNVLYDVKDSTYAKGTYGFWGNNCEQIAAMQIENLKVSTSTTTQKTLADAISNVSWRDGAKRFVVFTNEELLDYMSPNSADPSAYAKLVSSLLDANCHLILLGANGNEQQCRELLKQLNLAGLFHYYDPSDLALNNVEAFIKELLRKESKDTMYVLVNDKLNYNKVYKDYNGDPQWIWKNGGNTPYIAKDDPAYAAHFKQFQDNPSILAQKWEYFHDPDYYDNSLGLAAFDQEWIAHEVNVFDKVGRYEVDYRIKDNPVPDKGDNTTGNPFHEYRYWSEDYAATHKDSNGHITNPHAVIYVHRRPMAEYDFIARKVNDIVDEVDVTDHAYDLDHSITHAQKGLNLFEWKWKFASDQTWRGEGLFDTAAAGEAWINDQLTGLRAMGMDNILIQYRVRDIDGPAEKETVPITRKGADGRWVTSEETTVRNQGVWSLPGVRWVTNKGLPPVARFDVSNTVLNLGDRVTVTDRSYSPNGDNIVKWQWTIERATGTKTTITYQLGQNGITSTEKMEELFSKHLSDWIDAQPIGTKAADNSYKVTLVVTDDKPKPMESDPFSVTIKITAENQAPTVEPPGKNPDGSGTATGDGSDGQNSIFVNNNPTVYEYDSYDANLDNPYYYYNGRLQKRGAETLDWSILLDDPDNHDKYGPGNDSSKYKVTFALDRFLKPSRAVVVDGAIGVQHINYPEKTVSREQALVSSNIAPFTVAKDANLGWGAWRITTSVTDVPNNDSTPKTAEMVTHATTKPLHLYIIPKLDLRDVHFTFDGVLDNQVQIPTGETVVITATTNDRSTGARIRYKDGDGKALSQEMTLVKAEGETKYWSADFVLPDNLEAEDLIGGEYFPYQVETYTNYGAKAGEETRTKILSGAANIHILPIKLFDFTVTGITDPSVTFVDPAMARDLAYDRNNSANGKLMKLGYAFNFELYSKGMKDADDSVRIRPTFWGYNLGTGKYDLPLDMYYRNEDDQYVLATTNPDAAAASGDDFVIRTREFIGKEIGSVRQLNLTAAFRTELDRSTQKWTARYGVPGTAVFIRKGSPLTENSMYLGDVLIRFDIEAMKHGAAKYNYVGKGQWHLERTDIYGNLIRVDKAKYADGDVLVMDGMNNAALDFESRPVWTKLR